MPNWGTEESNTTQVSGQSGCKPGFEGRCIDMLGRVVSCQEIRQGRVASGMYIMGDNGCNKSVVVAGKFLQGCNGTQEFWNVAYISAEQSSLNNLKRWLIAACVILILVI